MAAIASLTLEKDVLARVIYPEQNFTDKYAGIFHFQVNHAVLFFYGVVGFLHSYSIKLNAERKNQKMSFQTWLLNTFRIQGFNVLANVIKFTNLQQQKKGQSYNLLKNTIIHMTINGQ